MSSLWTDLLFMHGHITNLDLARRLAETPKPNKKTSGKGRRSSGLSRNAGKERSALVAGDCLPT